LLCHSRGRTEEKHDTQYGLMKNKTLNMGSVISVLESGTPYNCVSLLWAQERYTYCPRDGGKSKIDLSV
jgi:hypothetical protein